MCSGQMRTQQNAKQSPTCFQRSPAERAHDGKEYAHACPINYKDTNHLHARLIKGSSAPLHRDFPPIRVLRLHLQAQRANLCDCQEM